MTLSEFGRTFTYGVVLSHSCVCHSTIVKGDFYTRNVTFFSYGLYGRIFTNENLSLSLLTKSVVRFLLTNVCLFLYFRAVLLVFYLEISEYCIRV